MKIFTTALVSFITIGCPLTANANYNSLTTEYPADIRTIAVIGGAYRWEDYHSGCAGRHKFSAGAIGVTITTDAAGAVAANVVELNNIDSECSNFDWKATDFDPPASDYFPQGTFGVNGTYGATMWTQGSQCPLNTLPQATATVLQATGLQRSPGTHTRRITVELAGIDARGCSVLLAPHVASM